MKVLILGESIDPHVRAVTNVLKQRGVECVIFERYKSGSFTEVSFHKKNIQAHVIVKNKRHALVSDYFSSVWWRVKPVLPSEVPGIKCSKSDVFRAQEWKQVLPYFSRALAKSKWLNPLDKHSYITKKVEQLALAAQCGLSIPRTAITNNQKTVLELFEHGRVIYKPLAPFFGEKKILLTNEISYSQVKKKREAIGLAPGIFQTLIEKKHELRVTVVKDKLFTAKIDSQKNPLSAVDWRRDQTLDMFTRGTLSEKTAAKLLAFHKKSELIYAAYDFILDTEGNEVFLECNPGGQWLWLDNELNLGITKALADYLVP